MSDSSDLYKIGTVAKLTGIAVERLRAWERRYGLTPASREGKTRFFSGEQVERLTRIKRLIDQGHPVSTLINLDSDTLHERLQQIPDPANASTSADQLSVGLAGTQLLMLEQMLTEPSQITVSSRWVNLALALNDIAERPTNEIATQPDVLVTLLGSVTPRALAELDALPQPTRPIVVYHYATEAGLADAAHRDWELLRWPVSWADIEQAVARQARQPLGNPHLAARRFTDEQLLTIATSGSGLGCACPADLVNLISALNAFSDHSGACSTESTHAETAPKPPARAGHNGNGKPFGAARHAQIAQRTSQARLELELVLEEWVTAEGLLPVPN